MTLPDNAPEPNWEALARAERSSVTAIPLPVQHREVRAALTVQEIRSVALARALTYFSYVERTVGPDAPPVGALTVLGMADHFVAYITSGDHPERET